MNDYGRSEAKKNQAVGNVKDTLGGAVGNESLQAKGKAQNATGETQEHKSNMKNYAEGTYDQAAGAIKGAANSLTGNKSAEAQNKAQQKKGEAQKNVLS